jgi:transcriptional regulator with XRE-family HTH domain
MSYSPDTGRLEACMTNKRQVVGEPSIREHIEQAETQRMAWRLRLKSHIETRKISTRKLGRMAAVGSSYVSDLLTGRTDPTLGNLMRVAEVLQLTLGELLDASDAVACARRAESICKLMTNDGDEVEKIEESQFFEVEHHLKQGSLLLLIDTVSLEPRFGRGDVVVGLRSLPSSERRPNAISCIAETIEGRRLFRVAHPTNDPDTYDLVSFDPQKPVVRASKLRWLAPIYCILKQPHRQGVWANSTRNPKSEVT